MIKKLAVGLTVLLLLALVYVGSYLLLLDPFKIALDDSEESYLRLPLFHGSPTISEETWLHTLYHPLLELDKQIRPEFWFKQVNDVGHFKVAQ